jgi:hypothetical protein
LRIEQSFSIPHSTFIGKHEIKDSKGNSIQIYGFEFNPPLRAEYSEDSDEEKEIKPKDNLLVSGLKTIIKPITFMHKVFSKVASDDLFGCFGENTLGAFLCASVTNVVFFIILWNVINPMENIPIIWNFVMENLNQLFTALGYFIEQSNKDQHGKFL